MLNEDKKEPKLIVLTGPESTAKSTLSEQLAEKLGGYYYSEYARTYLQHKGSDYAYEDVVEIARRQYEQFNEAKELNYPYVFFDTWLLITKIWFDWSFHRVPDWIEPAIRENSVDLYLLCRPDIPWIPDPLRENGGKERLILFEEYKKALIEYHLPYKEIGGQGNDRFENALNCIRQNL